MSHTVLEIVTKDRVGLICSITSALHLLNLKISSANISTFGEQAKDVFYLRDENFWVYGFSANSDKNFTDVKWVGNNILLFGSEGHGLNKHTEKYTDFSVKININKNIESLNISNSAAIVFHHINQQK